MDAKPSTTSASLPNTYPSRRNPYRIRFTIGGNRIDHKGKVSTPTAELTTIKILFNSILSTKGVCFMTADIKDFYLNTPMNRFEYMRIPVKDIPPQHHG
jgi:hypothetical protein